jgi:hypothetical protein
MWGDTLARTTTKDEKDPTTHRRKLRLHSCRKYFRTYLPLGGVPVDVVEALMGHEEGLTAIYRQRLGDGELARLYLQGEPAITIASASAGVRAQAAEVSTLMQKNDRLTDEMETMKAQLKILTQLIQAPSLAEK